MAHKDYLPSYVEAIEKQNSAYRTLVDSLEKQLAILRKKETLCSEAIKTLESEREANTILTTELENRDAIIAHLMQYVPRDSDGQYTLPDGTVLGD